ncbi:DUF533 domain-containing protein [Pseudomonadota bacterium]
MVDTLKILGALLGGGAMSKGSGASVLQSVLGAAMGGGGSQSGQGAGGLGDLLGSVLGGSQSTGARSGGGLDDMRRSTADSSQSGGGLGDLLGSVLGGGAGQQPQGGGLGDLLGGVLGGAMPGAGSSRSSGGDTGSLGDLINSALNQFGNSEQAAQNKLQPRSFEQHSPGMVHDEACEQATLMIRAMINAAKSDGRVDKQEQEKIFGKLGHVTQDEIDFVRQEMSRPLDVGEFVRSVPRGMGNQVYAMSLMALDLDSNPEAQYLHQLAQGLHLSPETVNQVHKQLGAPLLYG